MLYIMRHGKTDWNAQLKLQGKVDIQLNEEGRQMAREAKEKYKDMHFDVCYCSPLIRARETAELFLEGTNTPIIPDDRLSEMGFGKYEGMVRAVETKGTAVYTLFNDPENFVATDGVESFEELYGRTGDFIKTVVEPELKKDRSVLIVAHGALNSSIITRYQNTPICDFWKTLQGNCELLRLV